jgi:hypothetical protein
MNRTLTTALAASILLLATARAQDVKFATDNLKYSRDFYAKVHFIAIAIQVRSVPIRWARTNSV